MKNITIGIVEDNLLIAESLRCVLNELGYITIPIARSYNEAISIIQTYSPDLLIIDIVINGLPDGIDLAAFVKSEYNLPFIFLTANSDPHTVSRAKLVRPYAFLLKPFSKSALYSSIEIAFGKFSDENLAVSTLQVAKCYLQNVLFVKEGDVFQRLAINEIVYVVSENIYLNVFTAKKKYVIRHKLDVFIKNQCNGQLLRVHRSYAVNPKFIEHISMSYIKMLGYQVPIHKNYRQSLLDSLTIVN